VPSDRIMSSEAPRAVDQCRCTAPAPTNEDAVVDNLLNQHFNSVGPDKVWVGDTTYLKIGEGWMYLAIVMDLYLRRIVGWYISKRMTTDLTSKAMMRIYSLRQPPKGLWFHSDQESQYTSHRYW
jgi:putative transposase